MIAQSVGAALSSLLLKFSQLSSVSRSRFDGCIRWAMLSFFTVDLLFHASSYMKFVLKGNDIIYGEYYFSDRSYFNFYIILLVCICADCVYRVNFDF